MTTENTKGYSKADKRRDLGAFLFMVGAIASWYFVLEVIIRNV